MDWTVLGVFALVNFVAASSGGIFAPGQWYESLSKPGWIPPNWAFPTVWTVLFVMNTVAGALAWEAAGAEAGGRDMVPFAVYGIGLFFNFMWSALFFGLKRMDLALGEVAFLWMAIIAQIGLFWPLSSAAALLGVPYLLWVTVAAVLNVRMIQLNPPRATATG